MGKGERRYPLKSAWSDCDGRGGGGGGMRGGMKGRRELP